MKNQKGVTLIALVVTIIVLIILAGVAIAALLGDNGLITRSRESKKLQIEGEVRDTVTLAVTAAKVTAENEATKNAGFLAQNHITTTAVAANNSTNPPTPAKTTVIYDALTGSDLTAGNGFTVTATTGTPTGASSAVPCFHVSYHTDNYDNATNTDNATIQCDIFISGNNFTVDNWAYTSVAQ